MMAAVYELAQTFASHAATAAPAEELEAALRAAFETGALAWPGVPLDARQFAAHLGQHAPRSGDLLAWLAAAHRSDLFLACACAQSNPAALSLFDQRLLAEVPSFLQRRHASPELGEEVRQLLRERLLLPARGGGPPRISAYAGRGPLATWVRVAALRLVATLRRRPRPEEPLEDRDLAAELSAQDPELHLLRGRHGAEIAIALREAFESLERRDRALLRLHFLDGLNLERLGMVFQVSRATAGRMMLAARTELFEQTLRLLRSRLRIDHQELESLLGALRSGLDVSLHALLREP